MGGAAKKSRVEGEVNKPAHPRGNLKTLGKAGLWGVDKRPRLTATAPLKFSDGSRC